MSDHGMKEAMRQGRQDDKKRQTEHDDHSMSGNFKKEK